MSVVTCECARSIAPLTAIEPPPPSVARRSRGVGAVWPTVRRFLSPTCRARIASAAGGATLLSVISTVALVSSSASIDRSVGPGGLAAAVGCDALEAGGGACAVISALIAAGVVGAAGVCAVPGVAAAGVGGAAVGVCAAADVVVAGVGATAGCAPAGVLGAAGVSAAADVVAAGLGAAAGCAAGGAAFGCTAAGAGLLAPTDVRLMAPSALRTT